MIKEKGGRISVWISVFEGVGADAGAR